MQRNPNAGVGTARNAYTSFLNKMHLYCTKVNQYVIQPDYEKMCTSFMESKIDDLTKTLDSCTRSLKIFSNPSNVRPTRDCINLVGQVKGVVNAIKTGKMSCIPVYKYCKTTFNDLKNAFKNVDSETKAKYTTIDQVLSDLSFERDGVYLGNTKLAIEGTNVEKSLELNCVLENTQDTTAAIIIGDNIYSTAYVIYDYTSVKSQAIMNYLEQFSSAYTGMVNIADLAKKYK